MVNHDPKNDAHRLSNYNEWKKTSNVVSEVEINLETTGITLEDLSTMIDYILGKKPFCLYGNEGIVIIIPEFNAVKMGGVLVKYETDKQFGNAIKLLLFNFNKVYVPETTKIITDGNP